MDITEIRKRILIGLFSDDELMETLVLKGGNALALVHLVGQRASVDLDFSIERRFDNSGRIRDRIFGALREELGRAGFVLFDESFEAKPVLPQQLVPDWWGGYVVKFKLAKIDLFEKYGRDLAMLRRQCEVLGPHQLRTYSIDISHSEFCGGKERVELQDYVIYVYSLAMIIFEKLRAICQQMPEYLQVTHKRSRSRDFYDIWAILECSNLDLEAPHNLQICGEIFAAKRVPLGLLGRIENTRDFHRADWSSVTAAIHGEVRDFDYYFSSVVALVERLKTLWIK